MRSTLLIENLLFAIAVAGCGAAPLDTEGSTSGIRAAEEVGAKDVPQAALHLQLAKEELEKATKLSHDGESTKANSLLARAEADAELAVALSRGESDRQEAQKAMERVHELWRESSERSKK